jgi:hypothetical protein
MKKIFFALSIISALSCTEVVAQENLSFGPIVGVIDRDIVLFFDFIKLRFKE